MTKFTVPGDTRLPKDERRRIAFGLSGKQRVDAPAWIFKPHKPANPKKKAGCANDPRVKLHKDITVGHDALLHLANSSWWSWDQGSTLFFWRWLACHRRAIRDGTNSCCVISNGSFGRVIKLSVQRCLRRLRRCNQDVTSYQEKSTA